MEKRIIYDNMKIFGKWNKLCCKKMDKAVHVMTEEDW